MTTITELLAKWDSGTGKPYKGRLIDWEAYSDDPDDLSCMCAQGQVLHTIGGWEPKRLEDITQEDADRETAKLLNISVAHAILLRNINDSIDGSPSIVLTEPGMVLGGEWSKILDFWWHMDQMTDEQWDAVRDDAWSAAWAVVSVARGAARTAAWDAAWAVVSVARGAVVSAAGDAAMEAAGDAAGCAASEIQGARILIENGNGFFFLPMFGFADPSEIPARPANYGAIAEPAAMQGEG